MNELVKGAALVDVLSDPIGAFFVQILLSVFVITVAIHLILQGEFAQRVSRFTPSALTTIGVLGTFVGVFVGLLAFDVHNIDASVPLLLGGLRLAFFSSILGMGLAIIFRFIQTVWPVRIAVGGEEIGAAEIYEALRALADETKAGNAQQTEGIETLRKAIASDSDSSLVTQLQKLRSETKDGFDEQTSAFNDFAKIMAEQNSKALIEAIQQVMEDFNTQINDHLGDNFKQLNEAVGQLLSWQENYRQHVETLTEQFQQALAGIEATERSIDMIAERTQAIPATMQKLDELMAALKQQVDDMAAHLEAFAELKTKAAEALPALDKHFDQLSENFEKAVSASLESVQTAVKAQTEQQTELAQAATGHVQDCASEMAENIRLSLEQINTTMDQQAKAHEELNNGLNQMKKEAEDSATLIAEAADDTAEAVKQAVDEMSKELETTVRNFRPAFEETLKESISETTDALKQLYENWDKQMQEEVQRVVATLGSSLASLSGKFVDDYTPLTERLREVVNVARRV